MTDAPADENQAAARTLFGEGVAFAKQELWSEAEASFVQSGRLFPTSLAWLGAAIAAWNQGRLEVAATCIEWALHAIPIRETPQATEGLAKFERADWPGVERSFRELLNSPPVDTPTHLFLSIALIKQDRFEEAGQQLMAAWKQELASSEFARE